MWTNSKRSQRSEQIWGLRFESRAILNRCEPTAISESLRTANGHSRRLSPFLHFYTDGSVRRAHESKCLLRGTIWVRHWMRLNQDSQHMLAQSWGLSLIDVLNKAWAQKGNLMAVGRGPTLKNFMRALKTLQRLASLRGNWAKYALIPMTFGGGLNEFQENEAKLPTGLLLFGK